MEIIKMKKEGTRYILFENESEDKLQELCTLFEGYTTKTGHRFSDCLIEWVVDTYRLSAEIPNFDGDFFEFEFGKYSDAEARSILGNRLKNYYGVGRLV